MGDSAHLAAVGEPLVSTRISGRKGEGRQARSPIVGTPGGHSRAEPALTPIAGGRRLSKVEVMPRHVTECHETGARNWWIYTWEAATGSRITRSPYRCQSWRCPVCRRHEGAVTFARVREALESFPAERIAFGVLTLDRDGYYSGEPWRDEQEAYRALSRMSRLLLKRVNRHCKKNGWEPVGSQWVATIEAHRSGWPHLQIVMVVPDEWAEEIRNDEGRVLLSGWYGDAARACGWGARGTLSIARDRDAVNGYLVKTAGQHEASVGRVRGELIKLSQLPTNAPVRFRRLRSGKGFLPPRTKNPAVTGTLLRRAWSSVDGTPQVMGLHRIYDEEQREIAQRCANEEERRWGEEMDLERSGGPLLLAPGIRRAVRGPPVQRVILPAS